MCPFLGYGNLFSFLNLHPDQCAPVCECVHLPRIAMDFHNTLGYIKNNIIFTIISYCWHCVEDKVKHVIIIKHS